MRLIYAWLQLSQRKAMYGSATQLHARMQRAQPAAAPRSNVRLQVQRLPAPQGWQCTQLSPAKTAADTTRAPWIYLHGGAYVFPITAWHWRMLRNLVLRSGCSVLVVQYPLAPHSTCATTIAALQSSLPGWLDTQQPWGVMGDSAGGGMALALSLAQRDAGLPPPRKLLLITPWVDITLADPECQHIAPRDPMLAIDGARTAGQLYAGQLAAHHPWCSPVHAQLHALPPLHIWCAENDVCTPATLRLAEKATQAGTKVHLHHGRHMPHVWPLLPATEGRHAQQLLAQAIRD